MQRQMQGLKGGPKDLLKSNLHSFLSCVDAQATLQKSLEEEKDKRGWPVTQRLEGQIVDCKQKADSLFSEVLGRKERADATRNALTVLTRFKFLFYLPHNIEKNLEKVSFYLLITYHSLSSVITSGRLRRDPQRLHTSEDSVWRKRSLFIQRRYCTTISFYYCITV